MICMFSKRLQYKTAKWIWFVICRLKNGYIFNPPLRYQLLQSLIIYWKSVERTVHTQIYGQPQIHRSYNRKQLLIEAPPRCLAFVTPIFWASCMHIYYEILRWLMRWINNKSNDSSGTDLVNGISKVTIIIQTYSRVWFVQIWHDTFTRYSHFGLFFLWLLPDNMFLLYQFGIFWRLENVECKSTG